VLKRSIPYHPGFRKMLSSYLKISKQLDGMDETLDKLTAFNTFCPLPQLGRKKNKTPP